MYTSSSNKPNLSISKKFGDSKGGYSISGLPDSEIWDEFKNGNEGAFNHIYLSYFQPLFKYGQQFTGDTELIKDLIQDLFVKIRKNRKNLGKAPSIRFYLMKAFRRDVFRYLKKRKVEYKQDIEPFSNIRLDTSYEIKLQKEESMALRDEALKKGFSKLTEKQREAIYYYFYQSLSYQEIAEIMGFSHARSARNLVYRGIEKMKARISVMKYDFFSMLIQFVLVLYAVS